VYPHEHAQFISGCYTDVLNALIGNVLPIQLVPRLVTETTDNTHRLHKMTSLQHIYLYEVLCVFVCLLKTRKPVRRLSPNFQGMVF